MCHCLTVVGQAVLFWLQKPDEKSHCFSEGSKTLAQNSRFEVYTGARLIRHDLPLSAGEEILPLSCFYPAAVRRLFRCLKN